MQLSTLTSKGQTTIPRKIREYLHLHTGDKLNFVIEDGGQIVLYPATLDIKSLAGLLKRKDQKPVPFSAMEKAIKRGACRSVK